MSEKRKILDYEILRKVSEGKSTITEFGKGPDGYAYLKTLKSFQSAAVDIERLHTEYETQRRIKDTGQGIGLVTLREFEGLPVLVSTAAPDSVSLEERLDGKPFSLRNFLRIAISISRSLGYIHEAGVIHKDISPKNIMLGKMGEAQIINFEFSSYSGNDYHDSRTVGTLEGSLLYMSPEQTQRMNRPTDYRTDLYSTGVIFYQMLCGRLPFDFENPMDLIYSHIARQPIPPAEVVPTIPEVVSRIVMKLLSKNAEDRYSSGFGLQHDLELCLDLLTTAGEIEMFAIGQHDVSRRLNIPQKLYGRDEDKQKLLTYFEKASHGHTQFVLVSGSSGVGKTRLVNDLSLTVTSRKGYFVSGKFDKLQNTTAYSAITQAMRSLLQEILLLPPQQIVGWRQELRAGLGHYGQVLVEYIPELEAILGPLPEVVKANATESKLRLKKVLQKFISVFTKPQHPLVVFLDDLQWMDSDSLDWLKLVLSESQHLLIIGAYCEHEMPKDHPLTRSPNKLGAHEVSLLPMRFEHLEQLLSDTLRRPKSECRDLCQLLIEKTGGNPHFVSEFLRQLIRVDALKLSEKMIWTWDIGKAEKLNATDNVVQLMSDRVRTLPEKTQQLLKLGACVGDTFDYKTLATISSLSITQVTQNIADAVREGLLISTNDHCQFSHVRIQKACYEITTAVERAELHYRIGKTMLASLGPEQVDQYIMTIANHLNAASELIKGDPAELAKINLRAAQSAKASAVHDAAAKYASMGLKILGTSGWIEHSQITLDLHLLAASSNSLLGQVQIANELLQTATAKALDQLSQGRILHVRIQHLCSQGKYNDAITCGIEALKLFGIDLPEIQDRSKIQSEYDRAYSVYSEVVRKHSIDYLFDLPVNDSAEGQQVAALLAAMLDCTTIGQSHYLGLVAAILTNFAIANGNTEHSAMGFSWLGVIEIGFGRYEEGYALGELSLRLLEEKFFGNKLLGPQLNVFATFQSYLKRPSRDSYPFWERAFQESVSAGDHLNASYSAINSARQSIMWNGSTLHACEEFVNKQLLRVDHLNTPAMAAGIRARVGLMYSLMGKTAGLHTMDYKGYNEVEYLRAGYAPLSLGLTRIFHVLLAYMRGDFAAAKATLEENVFAPLAYLPAHTAELHLLRGMVYSSLQEVEKVRESHAVLASLARCCPENFEALERIVAGELAQIDGQPLEEVLAIYEQAAKRAREYGFLNFAAIAFERAARVCEMRGQKRIFSAFIQETHTMYAKWGALAKVRQIEQKYPAHFPAHEENSGVSSSENRIITSQGLDLATALNAAQAMSGEMKQERLLVKMMRTMLECGGAQMAVLALNDNQGEAIVRIRAEASKTELLNVPFEEYQGMCLGVVRFVQRTQQIVSLDHAARDNRFNPDPYVKVNQTKSVLCLPVQAQGRPLGYLYLENNLAEGAFNADRVDLLKMLASHAAISLENSALYANMEQRVKSRTQELNQSLEILKAAQAQLANSSKMSALGQMAGGIAHEINTPLAIVQLQVENLKDLAEQKPLNETAMQKGLDIILSTTDRVAKIIKGLRSFSRDGSNDEFEDTSIRKLFDQTLALCSERFRINNMTVDLGDIDPDLMIPCRATEISQVVLNLFNNAFDATDAQSERWIRVSVIESADDVKISITDSGNGIPEKVREKLFEPFFTTKAVGKGTGLGLSISQGILRNHGGDLKLDTSNPNTCFIIQLPKKASKQEKAS